MLPIRSLLFATDFSEGADAAFHFACSIARDHGADMIVLHAYLPPVCYGEIVARAQDDGYIETLQAELRRLVPPESVRTEFRLEEGAPAEVVVRVAKESACDLIVMGTHGRTGLGRMLLGSVAEEVVRQAPCPVLTIRLPHGRAATSKVERRPEAIAH